MKKDDFKLGMEDLKFWRGQTSDLKNRIKPEFRKDLVDDAKKDDLYLELKAGREELLAFRKQVIEDITPLPDLTLEDNVAGVDKNTQRKFKTGKMPVDAELDMHGMTQEVAFNSLINFVNSSYDNDRRCVLVITGKGLLSANGGVLRRSLPIWVNDTDIRSKILSFCVAHPGAYYLLLKRRR